ncbi:MAG: PAS domain S-box protein, partial [Pseudomonadota bacterium]
LRSEAETRLSSGMAPPTNGWTLNPDTLTLLYRLASDPDTASDGLKLLHELQTHQVELDLQQSQMEANEREANEQLTHYRVLFEAAPVGYLVVALDGNITQSNPVASQLLGMDSSALESCTLDTVLTPCTQTASSGLMEALTTGAKGACYRVQSADSGAAPRSLVLNAGIAPDGNAILITLSEHA